MYQTTISATTSGNFTAIPAESEFARLISKLQITSQELQSAVYVNSNLLDKIRLNTELNNKLQEGQPKEVEPSDILGKLFKLTDDLDRAIIRLQGNNSKLQGLV